MNEESAIQVIRNCSAIFAIWFVWLLWRDYALDRLRQELFKIRDDLFDLATTNQHGLTFDHRAYVHLRKLLNGLIRFGHTLTLGRLLGLHFTAKLSGQNFSNPECIPQVEQELKRIDSEELRKALQRIRFRAFLTVFRYIGISSPLLFPLCLPILCIEPWLAATGSIMKRIERFAKQVGDRGPARIIALEAEYFAEDLPAAA